MTEIESLPKYYGFKVDSVTADFVSDVLKIYEDTVGKTSGTQRFMQQFSLSEVNDIKNELTNNGYCERRLGSNLDTNSKLIIKRFHKDNLCVIKFNPNLDFKETDEAIKNRADKMKNEFDSRINEFLLTSGKGIELKI